MDQELRERIERQAEIFALRNAIEYDSKAQADAVMGPLMGDYPEFREYADAVPDIVSTVVDRVNELDSAGRRDRLADLAPAVLEELEQESEAVDDPTLPDLPHADSVETVRMRLAPNPNGPWHIGHARMPAVIGTYKDRYDGWFAVRFDDTDPETKRPDLDAYDWILRDIDYLGFDPDTVIKASDRLELYYDHARELIDKGGAYTCSCPAEEFSAMKNEGIACEHRDIDQPTVREEFEAMVNGEFDAGERVLRVRTDIDHPNPALRDWVAFRIIETPHPREAAAGYRCWPLLDFQSGIDDHRLEITHIIRGIDLQDSAKRQQFLFDYFDWTYPEVIHWGHVHIDEYDIQLSTSALRDRIEDGDLTGWDDPRAPTLMSLRRRGIRGEALTEAMIELGTSTSNVELAMSSVYSRNRKLIDEEADRLFFIRDGIRRQIIGGPDVGEPPIHPEHEERGVRTLSVEDGVVIESDDLPPHGDRVWLKGFGCVRHTRDAFEYTGDDITAVRDEDVDVIHWLPAEDNSPLQLRTVDGDIDGRVEQRVSQYSVDDVVQFERVGFARLDSISEPSVAIFAHS